jgi:hypothetical protein
MTTAPMRHFNSPAELAKREAGEGGEKPQHRGFRHWNHPEEIAKRERDGVIAKAIVVPGRSAAARPERDAEPWPPAGQENTASVIVGTPPAPRTRPLNAAPDSRLGLLEECVYALLDTPSEAREFRMHLSNIAAVVESQRDLIARVKALEAAFDDLPVKLEEWLDGLRSELVPADEPKVESDPVQNDTAPPPPLGAPEVSPVEPPTEST